MAPARDPTQQPPSAGRIDQDAIRALLEQHLPGLQAFLRQRMGGACAAKESSADLAQSVCREVLQRLADGRLQYHSAAEFRQWLYNAALFKVQDRHKYWGRERRGAGVEVPPVDGATTDRRFRSLRTPSQDAILEEKLSRFEAALAELPPEQQRVVVLARIEGRSHREIAAELSITESHSRVLLARALARLARRCDERTSAC